MKGSHVAMCAAFAVAAMFSGVGSGAHADSGRTRIGHLFAPTDAAVLPDGRLLVAEKAGIIKVFPELRDSVPITVLDLSNEVFDYRDYGLLSIEASPSFETDHLVYFLYDRDIDPATDEPAPVWGTPGVIQDTCPQPDQVGCRVTAHLEVFRLNDDGTAADRRVVLANEPDGGWCFGFDGHGSGDLLFGPEGALYVSTGDGSTSDTGDVGSPDDRTCSAFGDEDDTEGGALRALDALTPSAYTMWNGSVLRIDAATGKAWPGNPLSGGAATGDDRIVALGFRNPFRLTYDATANVIDASDVGANASEEVDVITLAGMSDGVQSFGWPCEEGIKPSSSPAVAARPLCTASPAVPVTDGQRALVYGDLTAQGCPGDRSAIIGGSVFGTGATRRYVFADWTRGCMLAVPILPDLTLDLAGATVIDRERIPAAIRDVSALGIGADMMLVDVADNAVYLQDAPWNAHDEHVAMWRRIVPIALLGGGLGTVVWVGFRGDRRRRKRAVAMAAAS